MKKNKKVISLDSSKEMILQARKKGKGNFILGDMFNLPFEDNYFDGVVIGRVFQHFGDISPILSQAKRVLKSGGIITFDTWIWSPRSFHRLFSKNHPKAVYNHSISSIKKTLKKQGLKLIKYEGRFLLPPGIYRMFPFFIVRILNLIEKAIPNFLRNKTFWKVTKI